MRGLKLGISKEEKVAMAIGKQLSDYSLDLEAVGKYLAVAQPYLIGRARGPTQTFKPYYDQTLFFPNPGNLLYLNYG